MAKEIDNVRAELERKNNASKKFRPQQPEQNFKPKRTPKPKKVIPEGTFDPNKFDCWL